MLNYQNKKRNLSAFVEKFERKNVNTYRLKNTILVGITYCLTYQIVQNLQMIIFQIKNEQNQLVPWILPAEGIPLAFLLYFGLSILPFVYVSFLSNEIILNSPLTILFVLPILKTFFYGLNSYVLRKFLNLNDSFQALENVCHFFVISFLNTLSIPILLVLFLIMSKSFLNSSSQVILTYIFTWFFPVITSIFSTTPFLILVIFPLIEKALNKRINFPNIKILLFKSVIYSFIFSIFTFISIISSGTVFPLFLIFIIIVILKFTINEGIIVNEIFILYISIVYKLFTIEANIFMLQMVFFSISSIILIIGSVNIERNANMFKLEIRNERLRESENRYKNLTEHLEDLVNERTIRLEQMYKDLELFGYSLSHDLKTPIQSIRDFSILWLQDPPILNEKEKFEIINKIKSNSERLIHLIDDLMDFFRFQNSSLSKSSFRMDKLIQNVIDDLNIEREQIQITIKPLPVVTGDFSLLSQVWINLLTNAIKYSKPEEKLIIEIGFEVEKDVNIFYIQDNGIGFDMKNANKLFKSFSRLSNSSNISGTGIGLYFVKKILESHHGEIWAESLPSIGTIFYFSLPK